jgi:NADH-quinone oxidoreductase subunit J
MNLPLVLLCIFAFLTVISAAGVLLFRNVLYAAFSLLITFLGVAALYVLAGADLLAVVQIVIYVGGVLVLLIFGIMLMQRSAGQGPVSGTGNRFIGLLAAGSLFGLLFTVIMSVNARSIGWIGRAEAAGNTVTQTTLPDIGLNLMTTSVLPFEVAGILLLVALIGAAYIAGQK